jgi:protein-disulfide isomerase
MRRAAVVAAALSLVVAVLSGACGGDDGSPAPGATAPGATATGPRAGATADARDPAAFAARKLPLELAKGSSIGKPDAKVTLEVFEDFQCPFCLIYTLTQEQVVMDEFVATGKVRFVFRNLPILGEESVRAALSATCLAEAEKFWPFHQRLFLEQLKAGQLTKEQLNVGRFSEANLKAYALEAGAQAADYDDCVGDPATLAKVQAEVTQAQTLGLRGTPALVLDGKVLPTPPNAAEMRRVLQAAVDAR